MAYSRSSPAVQPLGALDATVTKGPIMEEVRIQVSAEHRTRIRLWKSADPNVACRLELGHRIGAITDMSAFVFALDPPSYQTDAGQLESHSQVLWNCLLFEQACWRR